MGHANRDATSDLESATIDIQLPKQVESYNFYQLVELLHRLQDEEPESENWELRCRLLFSANPSLGFASSDVTKVESMDNGRIKLETTFFGLTGSQSPLPGFFLERIATEDENGLRKEFFRFFLIIVYLLYCIEFGGNIVITCDLKKMLVMIFQLSYLH